MRGRLTGYLVVAANVHKAFHLGPGTPLYTFESRICRVEHTLRAVCVLVSELFQHSRECVDHVPVACWFRQCHLASSIPRPLTALLGVNGASATQSRLKWMLADH